MCNLLFSPTVYPVWLRECRNTNLRHKGYPYIYSGGRLYICFHLKTALGRYLSSFGGIQTPRVAKFTIDHFHAGGNCVWAVCVCVGGRVCLCGWGQERCSSLFNSSHIEKNPIIIWCKSRGQKSYANSTLFWNPLLIRRLQVYRCDFQVHTNIYMYTFT